MAEASGTLRRGLVALATAAMTACGSAAPPTTTTAATTVPPATTAAVTTTSVAVGVVEDPIPLNPPICANPESCTHPLAARAAWRVPVLSIAFLPDADGDGRIDLEATGWDGSVAELRERITTLTTAGAWWMTEGTRYRGEGPTTDPSLAFTVVDRVEFVGAVPVGAEVPWNPGWHRPDYGGILGGLGVCRWIDGMGVREIWMWTQHHGGIEPAESNMSGPFGDLSNSEHTDDLPACGHSYTVYNFDFSRAVALMLHDRGHQMEALFERADPDLWGRFVGPVGSGTDRLDRCGNTHVPPNGESDYDYANPREVASDCLAWRPAGGVPGAVTCRTWFASVYGDPACIADEGLAYSVWWMQAIPGRGNTLTDRGRALVDWWSLFADLETAATDSDSWLLVPQA